MASDGCISVEQLCENDNNRKLQTENLACSQNAWDEIGDSDHSFSIDGDELRRDRPSSFRIRDSARSLYSSTSFGGGISSMLEADTVDSTIEDFIRKRKKELMIEEEDSSIDTNEDDLFGMKGLLVAALEKRKNRKKRIVQMEANELERRKSIAYRKRKRVVKSSIFNDTDDTVPADGIPDEIKMLTGVVGVVPAYKFASIYPDNDAEELDEKKTTKIRNGNHGTNEKFTPRLSRRKLRLPKIEYDDHLTIADWWKLTKGTHEDEESDIAGMKEAAMVAEPEDDYVLPVAPLSDLLPSINEKKVEDTKNSGNSSAMGLDEMFAATALERAQTAIDAVSVDATSVVSKNSGYGGTMGLNEMIAAAAAERQARIAKSERNASATKRYDYTVQAERDTTSVTASINSISTSTYNNDEEEEQNNPIRREMTIEETAANTELTRERTKERLIKAREVKEKQEQKKYSRAKLRVWKDVEYDAQQRKLDKKNHRKMFLPVAGEAATYGRLVRLEEKIVEGQGGKKFYGRNTWSGPKLRTDDRRSDAFRAIQEAAAMGRMKQPTLEQKPSHTQDSDFIRNFVDKMSDKHFDVDNQVDEHGQKIVRTTFLVDQYVKKTAEGKKHRMWANSEAIENRDHKTAAYQNFDDVQLPTDVLPTYQQILGKRSEMKRISSGSDLAVLAMKMSDKKTNFDTDEEDGDREKITSNQLRVLESISRDVVASAWERADRLQRPKAQLKVTRKCYCPYCKDPTPFQTHKYKLLMYPERFDDVSDNNNYCQVLADPEPTSNIAEAAQNSAPKYTISPGGRKKKIIRVVRIRKKKSGGDTLPTFVSLGDNKRVIDRSSLTSDQLDDLTGQLQQQGSNSLTNDELVQIADALKSISSLIVNEPALTKTEESSMLVNQAPSSPQNQQDPNADLSVEQLFQTVADSNDNQSTDTKSPSFRKSRRKVNSEEVLKGVHHSNVDNTKSPSSRKSSRKISPEEVLEGIDQSSTNNLSTSGRSKTKNGRRRPKGLVNAQSGNDLSPKSNKSQTNEIPCEKALSPKLDPPGRKYKKSKRSKRSKSARRVKSHSLSLRANSKQQEDDHTIPKPPRRIKSLENPTLHRPISSFSDSEKVQKSPKSTTIIEKRNSRTCRLEEFTEADLPRSGKANASRLQKPKLIGRLEEQTQVKSGTIPEDEDQTWQPVRRAPSRTKSLPISPNIKEVQSMTSSSFVDDPHCLKPPCRSFSFQDQLRNSFGANLTLEQNISSKSQSDRSLTSASPSPSKATQSNVLSSEDRKLLYELIASKNYSLPPSPLTPQDGTSDSLKKSLPFIIETATIHEQDLEDTCKTTTDVSVSDSSNVTQQQQQERLVKIFQRSKSLDRHGKIPRKEKKANMVEVTNLDAGNESCKNEDSHLESSLPDPVKSPKRRSHSMDPRITERGMQGLVSRKPKNKDSNEKRKRKKNFNKLKNWLKKGEKAKQKIDIDARTSKTH